MRAVSAAPDPTWDRMSVGVRWWPLSAISIVTHLVVHLTRTGLTGVLWTSGDCMSANGVYATRAHVSCIHQASSAKPGAPTPVGNSFD